MGLNLVIIGPPGSGKGTQAERIAKEMGLAHLSTGDLLRKEVAAGTPIGAKVKTKMETGALVPDELMNELVASHVLRAGRTCGFVLDGFPRTCEQAQDLANLMAANDVSLSGVVNITVPDQAIVDRLANRLTCPKCQRSYHATANPPSKAGVCDACGAALTVRKDDDESVIRNRIRVYWEQTAPVVEYYRSRGLLHDVDGQQAIDAIAASISELAKVLDPKDGPRNGGLGGGTRGSALA